MTEFEKFLALAERARGRKIAREAAHIWRERGPEAAAKFPRGFECFSAEEAPLRGRPCSALGCGPRGHEVATYAFSRPAAALQVLRRLKYI